MSRLDGGSVMAAELVVAHRTDGCFASLCLRLGCSFGCSSIGRTPKRTRCCPLAPQVWLCTWPEEGGPRLSASLRPGDPLPRPPHHRCSRSRARRRAAAGSERAAETSEPNTYKKSISSNY